MHPIASARLGKPRTAGRASSAKRMVFRILPHPEAEHDAFFRMSRRTGNEQEEPHVRGLSIGIGRGARLAGDLPRLVEGERERALLALVRLELPDRIAQWVHPRNHA